MTLEKTIAFRKRIADWRKNNPRKYRATQKQKSKKLKILVFSWYGNKCVCCGESDLDFLTLDHIHDDGCKDRVGQKGAGEPTYKKIRRCGKENLREDLQILCWNCQWGKRLNGGFCPHHPEVDLRNSSTSRLRTGLGVEGSSQLDYPRTSKDDKNESDCRDEMPEEPSLSEDTVISVMTAR